MRNFWSDLEEGEQTTSLLILKLLKLHLNQFQLLLRSKYVICLNRAFPTTRQLIQPFHNRIDLVTLR
uniref:Ovule protein n=1 Tax=Elaeophora elaphi TaxID=1147741 RepID=A0A0R3RLE8_9BILA